METHSFRFTKEQEEETLFFAMIPATYEDMQNSTT